MELCIKAEEVMADVRSAAWLEQELHPELDRHRRHEMADICEPDNVERVWRVLGLAVAEIRRETVRIFRQEKYMAMTNDLECPEEWTFRFLFPLPSSSVGLLREKIHEYLVASVMAERTGVIIPAAQKIWQIRASSAIAELRSAAATARPPHAQVRRPLWPC